ncbi:MAG: hypothetical protein ACYS14_11585, partial [Planctomycetota bacterium]
EAHVARKERDALESQLDAEEKRVSQLRGQLERIRELQGTIEKLQSALANVVQHASPGSTTADSGESGDAMVVDPPAGPD